MPRRARRYWLMKSEPNTYSISDLEKDVTTCWEGVRNYQARNTMRDDMKLNDLILFHHSSAKPPGVAGIARVAKNAYPDHYAFDKRSKYYDAKSDPENPRWMMVDVEFVEKFAEVVGLPELKQEQKLEGMVLLQRGSRLSVQPVAKEHFEHVRRMGRKKGP